MKLIKFYQNIRKYISKYLEKQKQTQKQKQKNMKIIFIDNIPIYFERRKRRSISVQIEPPSAAAYCYAPLTCSFERIEEFLKTKKDWIIKTQNKILSNPEKYQKQDIDESRISNEDLKHLTEKINEYVKYWEEKTNLKVNKISIRSMKTAWGSCTCRKANIRFAKRLAKMPDEFISYVVLHEICHIKYADHSKYFHDMLTYYMPNWKKINKESKPIQS